MPFDNESKFQAALIKKLTEECGWESEVIEYPTEEDLIKNFANILFQNNKERDVLNGCPLTSGEIRQIIDQISVKSPFEMNRFVNGKTVSIKRDNEKDTLHFEKVVSLKIYDRNEIASGKSRYQIVKEPRFTTNSVVYPKKRGDMMLLINGMPLFHIELKKSGVPISQATNQIEKYMKLNCFTGFFSMIQIFVAMNPEDAVYFANPGINGVFNKDFYFHWEDFENNIIKEWQDFAKSFLFIPRAHEMIGYYCISDATDGILKVMRSYQVYAAEAIFRRVKNSNWRSKDRFGGYVWHTTGSGKTMTSFKAAELIASSRCADKVIFLLDRVELGEQSFGHYVNFAGDNIDVNDTEDTIELSSKLKSNNTKDTLIVTSIQKMSRINDENNDFKNILEAIKDKKLVFIIDECHRDQNGTMHENIKKTFNQAMFFGFTGTPDFTEDKTIKDEKDYGLTTRLFGDELHRYTITYGIRDKNVLSFDPYKVLTFKDNDLRREVALRQADCGSEEEAMENDETRKIFMYYMNKASEKCPMTEIEQYVPVSQYTSPTLNHKVMVVKDICDNFVIRSVNGRFHAVLTTRDIPEAIEYYMLFTESKLNVTAIFDPNDDNNGNAIDKIKGIEEILSDYSTKFNKKQYTVSEYATFKKDVCTRLAHKEPYKNLKKEEQIDIVIVVNQLLTGFDSKYINTIYFDRKMEGKNLIQAISRTNRIYDKNIKPHGTVVFYRYPHTMEENLKKAVEEYSGHRSNGVFVDRLGQNIEKINEIYHSIEKLFISEKIINFEKLSEDESFKKKFAKLFIELNDYINSAKVQGFSWSIKTYKADDLKGIEKNIELDLDKSTYDKLLLRYKELFTAKDGSGAGVSTPFDIETNLLEVQLDTIDYDYINKKFKMFVKEVDDNKEGKEKILADIYNSFGSFTKEDQEYARQIIIDIEEKRLAIKDDSMSFTDYILEYKIKSKNAIMDKVIDIFGLDKEKLKNLINRKPNEKSINEYNEFSNLIDTLDKDKVLKYVEEKQGKKLKYFEARVEVEEIIKNYVLYGQIEL